MITPWPVIFTPANADNTIETIMAIAPKTKSIFIIFPPCLLKKDLIVEPPLTMELFTLLAPLLTDYNIWIIEI